MHGAARRLILAQGSEYTLRNATGGGGRDTPDYSDDGTLVGVLERRSRSPGTEKDSSGAEVDASLEIRAVTDSGTTIHEPGEETDYPTKLVHPTGQTYEVVAVFPEDSGVTVLTVVRD